MPGPAPVPAAPPAPEDDPEAPDAPEDEPDAPEELPPVPLPLEFPEPPEPPPLPSPPWDPFGPPPGPPSMLFEQAANSVSVRAPKLRDRDDMDSGCSTLDPRTAFDIEPRHFLLPREYSSFGCIFAAFTPLLDPSNAERQSVICAWGARQNCDAFSGDGSLSVCVRLDGVSDR